jgi:Domain of unknown function (DUF4118)
MTRLVSRDRAAALAGLAAPLALTAALIPLRGSLPNTDAALALVLVVVAVAAAGRRLAGIVAAVSAAVWFDFFLDTLRTSGSPSPGAPTSRPPR